MNDAEFRRRAHALLERCVVREEATGTKWTGELRALLAAGSAPELLPGGRMTCPVSGYAIRRRMPNEFGYGDNARLREYTVVPGAPYGFDTLDEALDFAASRAAERKPVCALVTGCARPSGHVGAHFMDWGMDT